MEPPSVGEKRDTEQVSQLTLSREQQKALLPTIMVGLTNETIEEVMDRVTDPKDEENLQTARSSFLQMVNNVGMEIDPETALRLGLPSLLSNEQLSNFANNDGPLKIHAQYFRMKQENVGKE